jgi:hypothetical protein
LASQAVENQHREAIFWYGSYNPDELCYLGRPPGEKLKAGRT